MLAIYHFTFSGQRTEEIQVFDASWMADRNKIDTLYISNCEASTGTHLPCSVLSHLSRSTKVGQNIDGQQVLENLSVIFFLGVIL